jgi:hypothetical protein
MENHQAGRIHGHDSRALLDVAAAAACLWLTNARFLEIACDGGADDHQQKAR